MCGLRFVPDVCATATTNGVPPALLPAAWSGECQDANQYRYSTNYSACRLGDGHRQDGMGVGGLGSPPTNSGDRFGGLVHSQAQPGTVPATQRAHALHSHANLESTAFATPPRDFFTDCRLGIGRACPPTAWRTAGCWCCTARSPGMPRWGKVGGQGPCWLNPCLRVAACQGWSAWISADRQTSAPSPSAWSPLPCNLSARDRTLRSGSAARRCAAAGARAWSPRPRCAARWRTCAAGRWWCGWCLRRGRARRRPRCVRCGVRCSRGRCRPTGWRGGWRRCLAWATAATRSTTWRGRSCTVGWSSWGPACWAPRDWGTTVRRAATRRRSDPGSRGCGHTCGQRSRPPRACRRCVGEKEEKGGCWLLGARGEGEQGCAACCVARRPPVLPRGGDGRGVLETAGEARTDAGVDNRWPSKARAACTCAETGGWGSCRDQSPCNLTRGLLIPVPPPATGRSHGSIHPAILQMARASWTHGAPCGGEWRERRTSPAEFAGQGARGLLGA